MAISYVGQFRYPTTDNENVTANAFTVTTSGLGASSGDVVLVLVSMPQATSGTWSVTTTGGQTWTEDVDDTTGTTKALYHCVFNGTWTANPVFTSSNAAGPFIGWATVWRGVDTTDVWDVDPAGMQSDGADPTDATWNTATNGAKAFVFSSVSDNDTCTYDNSMLPPSETGNVYWRTSGGTDGVLSIGQKTVATAGGVGTTICDYSANETYGWAFHAALKQGASVVESGQVLVQSTASPDVLVQRDLLRAGLIESTADIQVVTTTSHLLERLAEIEATADAVVQATSFHVLERLAEVESTADAVAQATYFHVLDRLADIESTADIVVERQIVSGYSTLERAAEIESTAELTVAGVIWSKFKVLNLVATPISSSRIDLEWDDVTALSGETYDIERNDVVIEENWASLTYSDTGLDPDTEYSYRVRAVGGTVV